MTPTHRVTIAYGDGIGPEIMRATLAILEAAGAPLEYDVIEIGEQVYRRGITSGIPDEAWELLRRNRVFLKAPITTPQGKGYKSLNVTIRKALGLFANIRPTKSLHPYVETPYPNIDLVIVRENEEDLYAAIEHRQTTEVVQALKLVSRPGSEGIIRYAFEYARAYGRRKVTCMTKDNILKMTDGLFHRIFEEIAVEYPELEADHRIIDIGAALVAARPETLDVVVTLNLYGDILSDIAAQVTGSVGLGGSANVGTHAAMFEAIHGSAPDIAGKDLANPSGLLNAAVMMLVHLGLAEVAARIENAWLRTIEDGIHTADIYRPGKSRQKVGTQAFAEAVIARLGQEPQYLKPVHFRKPGVSVAICPTPRQPKQLVGVDVFLDWDAGGRDPQILGRTLEALAGEAFRLHVITNRGVKVYPGGLPETFCTDHWRCRFLATQESITPLQILDLLRRLHEAGLEFIKTEHLYTFEGQPGYTLAQAE
jgi:isocitrate dehydrogenase